jgi:hypothetical protein
MTKKLHILNGETVEEATKRALDYGRRTNKEFLERLHDPKRRVDDRGVLAGPVKPPEKDRSSSKS